MDEITEGLTDYEIDREEADAREEMLHWAVAVATPCCLDCGWYAHARERLILALRRARAAGVFEQQPGEAEWLTLHRIERPNDF